MTESNALTATRPPNMWAQLQEQRRQQSDTADWMAAATLDQTAAIDIRSNETLNHIAEDSPPRARPVSHLSSSSTNNTSQRQPQQHSKENHNNDSSMPLPDRTADNTTAATAVQHRQQAHEEAMHHLEDQIDALRNEKSARAQLIDRTYAVIKALKREMLPPSEAHRMEVVHVAQPAIGSLHCQCDTKSL